MVRCVQDFQDDSNKNDKTESFHEDALGNLLAVLGNEISTESASDLLTRSKGDVESAVNKFYDAQRMSQAPKPKAVTQVLHFPKLTSHISIYTLTHMN